MNLFLGHSLSGLLVGLLVGITGVGGGSLMTPLLILVFGIHPSTAVGSDLLYASTTKVVGAGVHGWKRSVDWQVVGRLAFGSVPLTVLTILFCAAFHITSHGSPILNLALGAVLVFTALCVIFQPQLRRRLAPLLADTSEGQRRTMTILLGAVLGVVVTLTSVGAGAIGVSALVLLYPALPPVRLVGSDIAHAVPLTLLAGLGHWWLGDVDFALVGSLLLGSIPGVIIGSLSANLLPDRAVRVALALVLFIVGLRLLA
ncbi:sulfite exporter TauE/SafE family protein [Acidisoma sp. C75]